MVEGSISTDTVKQLIKLTKTTSFFYDQKPPPISGASVKVAQGGQVYSFSEDANQSGNYYSNIAFAGKQGQKYDLVIDDVDLNQDGEKQSYYGSEIMKNILVIDSIYAVKATIFDETGYKIFGFAQEPSTVGDYYLWRYFINGKLITDTLEKITFASDEIVNGNYLYNFEMGFITDGATGDTLTVETNSITKDYYNFIISFFFETKWSSAPFAGPPANIKTNIDNGAVGYFNTEARTRISMILP